MTNLELSWIDSYLLLGDVFLQTFFVYFDIQNTRVGMTRSLNSNDFTFALDPENKFYQQYYGNLKEDLINSMPVHIGKKAMSTLMLTVCSIPMIGLGLYLSRKRIGKDNLVMILGAWVMISILLISVIVGKYST